jgi:hypothetical protein
MVKYVLQYTPRGRKSARFGQARAEAVAARRIASRNGVRVPGGDRQGQASAVGKRSLESECESALLRDE